ncbi:DUF1203 domain-containing protein [Sphingorhabdus sp. M41]|uniref:DUF1203 domain-containing protein n=1 Tax=Sphingorhabdus sp. M41 TaxID=1806885 RepID=UPI00078DC1B6|nr:DUF1203 domain-containing protein [Sphingorhabdus sp. M41]AMO73379.1 hypothetical protein AZE99_10455 [Sphingorhabdus sp. M41]
MTYQITGLSPELAKPFQDATTEELSALAAVRMTATSKPGFPCRISLEDAEVGEEVILFHHMSHDVDSPYQSAYAIFVRIGLTAAARFTDAVPPVFEGRILGMRAFGKDAMLKTASLALPGDADRTIRQLFELAEIAYIDVHNAAHGCFAARVERFGS